MKIENVIEKLTAYAAINLMAEQADEIYIKNKLSDMVGLAGFESRGVNEDEIYDMENCDALVNELVNYALKNGMVLKAKKLNSKMKFSLQFRSYRQKLTKCFLICTT